HAPARLGRAVAGGAFDQLLGAPAVRDVIHPALDGHDPAIPGSGKGVDDGPRLRNGGGARGEGPVDDVDLVRVDRELGGEAVAHRRRAFGTEAIAVTEVELDRVDRLDAGGPGSKKAERPRPAGGGGR